MQHSVSGAGRLFAFAFVISGCGMQHSSDFPPSAQLVEWEPLAGRQCTVSPVPTLPMPGELLDTAAVLDSLRNRGLLGRPDFAAFSVVYDRNGLLRQEVIGTTLPDTTRAALTRLLDAHLESEFPVDWNQRYWGWQLRIDMAAPPHFAGGRQGLCRPERPPSSPVLH